MILALKFKLLQYEIANKSKTAEELDSMTEDHKREVQQLHGQLATRNDIIHKHKEVIDDLNAELQSKSEQVEYFPALCCMHLYTKPNENPRNP